MGRVLTQQRHFLELCSDGQWDTDCFSAADGRSTKPTCTLLPKAAWVQHGPSPYRSHDLSANRMEIEGYYSRAVRRSLENAHVTQLKCLVFLRYVGAAASRGKQFIEGRLPIWTVGGISAPKMSVCFLQ